MLVPAERIELPTFGLQNRCTTAVLRRRDPLIGDLRPKIKARLRSLLSGPVRSRFAAQLRFVSAM